MKFLIDTNILISLEPTSAATIEPGAPDAAEVARLIHESGNLILVHPLVLADIGRDTNAARRTHRQHVLGKYPKLADPPTPTVAHQQLLGVAIAGSNDWVDDHLLVAVERYAVDYLVTQDQRIHRKASRLNIADRVLTIADAQTMLRALFLTTPSPPPAVRATQSYNLDERDAVFDSFRQDYPGFDAWLQRCKLAGRPTWVIDGAGGELAAVCIVKSEDQPCFDMSGKLPKICSFKVSDKYLGARFGELPLKAVFLYTFENGFDWIYVTAFEKQAWLIALLQDFGFEPAKDHTPLGEIVLTKPGRAPATPPAGVSALPYDIRYGPCHLLWEGVGGWIVPIQPRYDSVLFPDRQEQPALFPGRHSFGNAIWKA